LRIVTNRPLNEYPESPAELEKLARRMGLASAEFFLSELAAHTGTIRETFERLLH
jgi:glutamine synthetase adenylyltransferase